jgi:tRNA threonylcarbamoyladenosine biosynthesis protein TsaB
LIHLLCIETSTTVCSVCITSNDVVIAHKEINDGFRHIENLHVFIKDILKEANLSVKQLSAVAVSKGPGSYTGLRIGVSAAKGLCYALQIPLISTDTLQSMAWAVAHNKQEAILYCPMLDARRMEVYCAVYTIHAEIILPVNALVLDEQSIEVFNLGKIICFFGDGMPKAKNLLEKNTKALFIDDIYPAAESMAFIAYNKFNRKQFEDVAYFEPFYLKEFFNKAKI